MIEAGKARRELQISRLLPSGIRITTALFKPYLPIPQAQET